jgi:hypothetical protein
MSSLAKPSAVQPASPSLSSPGQNSLLQPQPDGLNALQSGLIGIAIFDRSGILEGYETHGAYPNSDWAQAAFHTIGLKKLLTTSLKQQHFEYAKASAQGCTTFVLRRRNRYVAIVSQPQSSVQEAALARILKELSLMELIGFVRNQELAPVA